ncbi:protein unc-93 homolog A isoform X5 [Passer domesticus]|uniref:protein unc-93 homolog A isoform X5 n=1 Tax=Passer domesticus TaxID=48849 RepID=UPI0030FE4A11
MERNLKNVLVISFGFLFLFTAYSGLQSLQSSLNAEEGLGVASLSVLYAALTLSSMFLPPIIIKKLGCKWTIVVSMCCYIAYSLGNFYASWYTLIPTSMILGLGGAPLWSAKCTYLTIAGTLYAEKAGKNAKDIISQYFGIFFLVFQTSGIWGNLISSLILSQSSNQGEISEDNLECCGAYDCLTDTTNSTGSERPSNSLIYTLVGVYTAAVLNTSCIITVLLWKPDPKQLAVFFVIPGLWGVSDAVWQTQTNGAENSKTWLIKRDVLPAYLIWAHVVKTSLYGILFEKNKEAAFANYRLWESVGFVIAFAYSTKLQVYIKTYIVLSVLVLSMVTYGAVEYLEAKSSPGTPAATKKENGGAHSQETHM